VTADLGLSLLIKVLTITGKRPDLLEAARSESAKMRLVAAEDIAAVRALMKSRDAKALDQAIAVPMQAARSAAAGLILCAAAESEVHGLLAADLGAAAALLCGAVRAILVCVNANMDSANMRTRESTEFAAERKAIEDLTARWNRPS
jgi:formiminotetrahydrofolate cyclodeaminase